MKYIITLFTFLSLVACSNSKKTPDVSKIKVELTTQRFEKDFFALDTNHLDAGMQQLYVKYQQFYVDFLQNVLASDPQPDSVLKNVQLFTNAYKNIYTVSQSLYADVTPVENEIKQGLKLMKYYFPNYQLPTQLVTYLGPWDAMFMLSTKNGGSSIFRDGPILGIGLQLFLGSDYSIYKEQGIQEMYPTFISRRFDKQYITTNAIKVLIDDIYPDKSAGKPLVQQMIEAGKRLFILQALVPNAPDSITTGYTQQQLDGCYKNEANIWSFFVVNNLLFVNDFNLTKDYLNDAPNTQALGDESPGFIGQFIGWQIVKKWMKKNSSATLQLLLNKSAKEIFEEAKYKPQ
jgi:hypothetical protein